MKRWFYPTIFFLFHLCSTQDCDSITYLTLSNCNLTCQLCGSTKNKCEECPELLTLSGSVCQTPINITLFYQEFWQGAVITEDEVPYEYFRKQSGQLEPSEYIEFCVGGLYRYQMVGFFSSEDRIIFEEEYNFAVESVSLSFRLTTYQRINKLSVLVNEKKQYQLEVDTGKETTLNYTGSQVIVDQDLSSAVDTFVAPIRTGPMPVSKVSKVKITFYVIADLPSSQSSEQFWAFSEVTIMAKQCDTCVSDNIIQLGQSLGIAIGICAGVLIVLVVILCVCVAWRNAAEKDKQKNKFKKIKKNDVK